MRTYWVPTAILPTGAANRVRIEVDDGIITAVTPKATPGQDDIRLDGVLGAGLANGHSHAFHRGLRARTHGGIGDFWTWREQMYALARVLTPETYFRLARAVFVEMVCAGFTVVGEFHYLHHDVDGRPYADPNAMGHALMSAAREAGIRMTLLDTCYLQGGLSGGGHFDLDPVQRRFSDGHVSRWIDRVAQMRDEATIRIGAAAHSVRAVPREALHDFASVVGSRPVHAHVSEQLAENAACELHYGRSPTQVFAEAGLLGPRFTAVHATHVDDVDIRLLGRAGASACICPTTERDLADGIGPSRALADAGVSLCIGSDQHAMVDPFEELRGLEMHERLITGERGRFTIPQLYSIGTAHGYRALGWPEGGRVEVGALADFVVVKRDSPRTAGARPYQIGYAATSSDIAATVVAGELIAADGHHRLGDAGHLLADAFDEIRRS
jgi:formiminoglutamate deiminase